VGEFVKCVRGVCPCEHATSADDGENEDRVGDAVEGMDADAVARLQPDMAQTGDQVAYKGEGLGMAEGDAGTVGGYEDLSGGNVNLGSRKRYSHLVGKRLTGLLMSYWGSSKIHDSKSLLEIGIWPTMGKGMLGETTLRKSIGR
jgi:hypothetical protein